MTETKALLALKDIKDVCRKWGLWSTIEMEDRGTDKDQSPKLHMIRVKEISIKVTER